MTDQTLDDLRGIYKGVHSIIVTDKDGVEILSSPSNALANDEQRHSAQILSTIFSLTHEQSEKLTEFGSTNYMISEFGESSVLLQASYHCSVVTIRADRGLVSDQQLVDLLGLTKQLISPCRSETDEICSS